ncbi:fungal-specific transcription factor domain-containing protein [Aspergillus avenaceus]|uniref:Fungal-specific transcription factor domain-containing protein n=1 Tax=Aspergillus avenaceus TaxID=36643 RepID=A0A5N6TKL3_ASPAV|nr:fungal-specific transcription factor domain-containing protein [Aspergillus avenaceus]
MALYHSLHNPDHLDSLDLEILNKRDAFGLPPRSVCNALVECFFNWIAPVFPVVDRYAFMKRYNDPQNPPSILLLQAMIMVAARFHTQCEDRDGYTVSPRAFYKKAKALYDAGYERDPVTIVQAVVLLGAYWEGPDDLTESGIFYWSRLGIALAQELGLYDRESYAALDPSGQGLRKRIWWTLFTRDRSVAAAFGRPLHINLDDCTVEPLEYCDFIECDGLPSQDATDKTRAQFFIEYVRLCQLMDLGLCLRLSSRSTQDTRSAGAAQCELGLSTWLMSCPRELQWKQSHHSFLPAVLSSTFYTIVCQLHLVQAPYCSKESQSSAFHAASMIISILETLQSHGELRYSPPFTICHAVVSFVTLKLQMEASLPSLLHGIWLKLECNLELLEALSRTWPIAKLFLEFFQPMATPDKFNRLLAAAVEKCHERAHGTESNSAASAKRSAPFKRPKVQQVILPQSRIVLQILARETQKRRTALSHSQNTQYTAQDTEAVPFGIIPESSADSDESASAFADPMEDCDPSIILQNLQQIIQIGRLQDAESTV